jgi:hypothetical protein
VRRAEAAFEPGSFDAVVAFYVAAEQESQREGNREVEYLWVTATA